MARPSLEGRSILIVEDEPLIVMDITQQFEVTGAALTTTNTLKHALILVEYDGLSGAILDHALGDENSSLLCQRLRARGIPFMIYTGCDAIEGECKDALHISKPAPDGALVAAMEGLILKQAAGDQIEISPLLDEQRQVAGEHRVVEKEIEVLSAMIAARNVDPTDRAEMEAAIVIRNAALIRLGQRMLEIDTSVTAALEKKLPASSTP